MTITEKIKEQLKEAMKAKEALRVSVLRGLLAGFVNELVAKGLKPETAVTDEMALAVIKRQAKQRQDSIEQFSKGDRQDLVEKETSELNILKNYLPAELSEAEIRKVVEAKKTELGISEKAQMGQLIGAVMKELKGQADGAMVKKVVEKLLTPLEPGRPEVAVATPTKSEGGSLTGLT